MQKLQELISLEGKTAIVTGGAKGIGQAIVFRLSEAGASIVVSDIDEESAKKTADELPNKGVAVKGNVANEGDVEQMVKAAVDNFGGVDILVNNAGIYPMKPIIEMTAEEWDRVIEINLKGTFLCTKAAVLQMKQQERPGVIINIASIDALHPSMVGLAHYDASKGGVWMFTKNAALELAAYGIRINAIAPGGILTPGSGAGVIEPEVLEAFAQKIPMGRMGDPDDIGRVALFLASDMSAYMTGSMVVVDGGVLQG